MGTVIATILVGIGLLTALGACLAPLILPPPHGQRAAIAQIVIAIIFANAGVLLSILASGSSLWVFWTQGAGYISLFAFTPIATRNVYTAIKRTVPSTFESRSSELLHLRPRVS